MKNCPNCKAFKEGKEHFIKVNAIYKKMNFFQKLLVPFTKFQHELDKVDRMMRSHMRMRPCGHKIDER